MDMNKAELIESAVELGLDASGTKAALKDRLEAYRLSAKPVTSERVKPNAARHEYRKSAKFPK
jgi:hypothetical protein